MSRHVRATASLRRRKTRLDAPTSYVATAVNATFEQRREVDTREVDTREVQLEDVSVRSGVSGWTGGGFVLADGADVIARGGFQCMCPGVTKPRKVCGGPEANRMLHGNPAQVRCHRPVYSLPPFRAIFSRP